MSLWKHTNRIDCSSSTFISKIYKVLDADTVSYHIPLGHIHASYIYRPVLKYICRWTYGEVIEGKAYQ